MAMAAKVPGPGAAAEKRRNRRKNIIGSQLLTVDVALGRTPAERQWQRGIVIDLSEVGMAIQPFLPLTQGTVGDVRIELPGDPKPVTSSGMVAWVGQGGRAGIRFIDVPASAREQLREWLSRNPRGVPPQEEFFVPEPIETEPSSNADTEDLADAEREQEDEDSQEAGSEEVDFQAALQLIAERAQLITSASGAAVAIGDNNGMVCRASTGAAPDLGAQLRPDSGLSGYCLSSGDLVYCADTQADPRIDAAAARKLDLGSIIIVPVFVAGRLAGVLEVLSSRPQAFDDRQVIRLERFAELLGATVEEHQHLRKSKADDGEDDDGDDALKFTSATVPVPDSPDPAEPSAETVSESAETSAAAPPSPSFVFDVTLTPLPGAALRSEPEMASVMEPPRPEPIKEDLVTRVLSVAAALPEPERPSGPIFLATPAEWVACKVCGHQNPPWAKLCENCHTDGKAEAAAIAAPSSASGANNAIVSEGSGGPTDSFNETPLFVYSAPPFRIRWSRLALVAGVIVLVALAGFAGLYFGRRARVEQAPIPRIEAPASAVVTPPAPVLDDSTTTLKAEPQPVPPVPTATPANPSAPKHVAKAAVKKPASQLNAADRKTMWPEKGISGK
jgi:hypothetical protein